jgi:hypothetical protein
MVRPACSDLLSAMHKISMPVIEICYHKNV